MEEGKVGSIEDWMPKKKEVVVGEVAMVVREMTIAKRDAVVKVLLSNMEVMPLLQPFIESARSEASEGVARLNVGALADRLKDVAKKLLGDDLTRVCCIVLDVEENRRVSGVNASVKHEDPDHGFRYSEEFFDWVKENLTLRQEQEVITATLVVNDFVGLVKNYSTLVAASMKAARAGTTAGAASA